MQISPVDPRDIEFEVDRPTYRVYFWSQQAAPPGVPQAQMGWWSDEREITGAEDVDEVLAWAMGPQHGGKRFTLSVVVEGLAGRKGLLRLRGVDPTAAPLS